MAQSGIGYDPLHGYHPQASYAHQPYPSYPTSPLSYPNGAVRTIVHNETAPRDSYNHHNVIPGLGLNFSQNVPQWQGLWPNQQPPSGQEPPTATQRNRPSQQTGISEEGEVSEGEPEDIYEPRDAEIIADLSHMNRGTQGPVGFNDTSSRQVADDPPAVFLTGRDRSGSYSPYLSPQEIDHQAMTGSSLHEDQSNRTAPLVSSQSSLKTDGASHNVPSSSHVRSVSTARKQAQDAIQRLWPLNVRYQNYVEEGIDETLLGSLFEELGFEMGAPSNPTATQSSHEKEATSGTKDDMHTGGSQQQNDSEESPVSAPTKDKSEERKDRIARLLAAKSSKSSAPAVAASSTPTPAPALTPAPTLSSHTPVAKQQASAKTQSEKSKLLYQKMEALRKAREFEARGQKRPHPDELPPPSPQAKDNVDDSTATDAFDTTTNSLHSATREHTPGQTPSPSRQLIPGLFLSSTPQPAHSIHVLNLERPASTGLVDSNPRPFKRPFGQTRKSRPFLIDVSDDEDDAEMDIDSPEQKAALLAGKAIPSLKTSISLRSAPSFADNAVAAQQYSSPMATPPGFSSDNSATRDNLDNMTKKIEAMKRRIADAEARKKARQSRPYSPAFPTLNDESPGSSFEAAMMSKDVIVPASSSSAEPQELTRSTPPMSDPSQGTLPPLSAASPQSGNKLCSQSRAANERLPLIEARRREQQLKVQLLQAQIMNIQLEIQQSLEEEEKLKVDVDIDSDSEQTQRRQGPSSSKLSSLSSPLTDAMDIASISPQSSNATRQSPEVTPHRIEASQEEQQLDMLITEHTENAEQNPSNSGLITSQAADPAIVTVNDAKKEAVQDGMSTQGDAIATATVGGAQNTDISEAGNSSNEDSQDESDGYEPPDVELSSPSGKSSRVSTPFSPAPADPDQIPETDTNGLQDNTTDFTAAQQISAVQQDIASKSGREVDQVSEAPAAPASHALQTTFVPYESPLRYFHAYRFHPEYSHSVSGGLRSLTYSNKIDVKQEVCPDELAHQSCPRGSECEYQHFESMQAPDDQILLQLGAHGDFEEKKKQEYINGLRCLLTDFRSRKVKDFRTISQGIIDYRAQFLGDRSKILPLGGVTI
ncbi:hypothetical protein V8C37DRAFT_373603 [Trichoderma ceciliae]